VIIISAIYIYRPAITRSPTLPPAFCSVSHLTCSRPRQLATALLVSSAPALPRSPWRGGPPSGPPHRGRLHRGHEGRPLRLPGELPRGRAGLSCRPLLRPPFADSPSPPRVWPLPPPAPHARRPSAPALRGAAPARVRPAAGRAERRGQAPYPARLCRKAESRDARNSYHYCLFVVAVCCLLCRFRLAVVGCCCLLCCVWWFGVCSALSLFSSSCSCPSFVLLFCLPCGSVCVFLSSSCVPVAGGGQAPHHPAPCAAPCLRRRGRVDGDSTVILIVLTRNVSNNTRHVTDSVAGIWHAA
jgi:hypothetical protein